MCELPYPTDDTRLITRAALAGLERVYRDGFAYSKAEVLLLGLCQRNECTGDLFAQIQSTEANRVMDVLDQINSKWGRGTIRPGRVQLAPDWGMRREMMSQSYTTRLDQLWRVSAR
jgi:DNA polymerase V